MSALKYPWLKVCGLAGYLGYLSVIWLANVGESAMK